MLIHLSNRQHERRLKSFLIAFRYLVGAIRPSHCISHSVRLLPTTLESCQVCDYWARSLTGLQAPLVSSSDDCPITKSMRRRQVRPWVVGPRHIQSSSLDSSSSSSATFFADFFFFFLFLPFAPVDLAVGCSRMFKISSSMIFFSVLYLDSSGAEGPVKRTSPFLVMAVSC